MKHGLLRAGAVLGMLAIALPATTHGGVTAAASVGPQASVQLTARGTTSLAGIGSGSGSPGLTNEIGTGPEVDQTVPKSGLGGNTRVPADHVPTPAANPVTTSNPTLSGFNGISHADQRIAGTGVYTNTQFSLEPPDQALCANSQYVVEAVNNGVQVFTTSGSAVTPTVALNQFWHLSPEIIRSNPVVYGAFVSDPKCYWDQSTGRWFLTELEIDTNSSTDAWQRAHQEIAVSQSSAPTGAWYLYSFDTTDDGNNGTPSRAGCPCFGDQPLIGADANGFYVTTNEFSINTSGFNGAQVYAMSKTGLETGTLPTIVQINSGAMPTPDAGGIWYSLQPATTPPGGSFASSNGGSEYFLSALQFSGRLDNRIAVWALTNTSSLNTRNPNLSLTDAVLSSEVYGQPPNADQASGATPLASTWVAQYYGGSQQKPEFLAGNDDRMNQVVYANGELWSGINTVLQPPNGPARVGIAYFIVTPSTDASGQVAGTMANQGYVDANQGDVLFPSIGVNTRGQGVMTFTLVGPGYYPSAAYAPIDAVNGAGAIHVAASGAGPDDGFSGYQFFSGGRVARWGDYSAAVAAPNGSIWLATEYIPNAPRTLLANWGTFVGNVTP